MGLWYSHIPGSNDTIPLQFGMINHYEEITF